jgi:cell division protein FtsB
MIQQYAFFLSLAGALIGAAVYVKGQLADLAAEIRALRRDIEHGRAHDDKHSDRMNALEQRVATIEAKVNH